MNNYKCTIKELLESKAFTDKARLVNDPMYCSKVVSHVTIMEAPDLYRWVTGGEFVLTTWYSLKNDTKLAEQSFRKLAPKIAAIGIKTKRFIDEIPEGILKIADEFKVPVFEIKRETLFRELVTIIGTYVQNYQFNIILEMENFYKKLLQASASHDDVNQTMDLLYREVHLPCLLMNSELLTVSQKGNFKCWDSIDKIRKKLSEIVIEDCEIISAQSLDDIVVFPCLAKNRIVGYIFLPKIAIENDRFKLVCQLTTFFIGFRLWNIYEDVQKLKRKFIMELGGKEYLSAEYIISMMSKFGITTNENIRITLIYRKNSLSKMISSLDLMFNDKIIILIDSFILLIVNSSGEDGRYERIKKDLETKDCEYIVVDCVPTKDVEVLRNQYKLARDSIVVMKKMKMWGVRKLDEVQVYTLLYGMRESAAYRYVKQNILNPILLADMKYKSDLMLTLSAFIMRDSVQKTAEILHIHVNTLRYRLDKIREITGKDCFIAKEKYDLLMAVNIAELENLTEKFIK